MSNFFKKYFGDLYTKKRFFVLLTVCIIFFVIRFFIQWLGVLPFIFLGIFILFVILDYVQLFFTKAFVFAKRSHAKRMSNGDSNEIKLSIENKYSFPIQLEVIDEVPHQFQRRDIQYHFEMKGGESKNLMYHLRPVKRGEYDFGKINLFVSGPIGLLNRRFQYGESYQVPVYPSYLQLHKFQLFAISNKLVDSGLKLIRKIGHSMEFEQIKEYVAGDDFRTMNWKATARKGQFMINNFTEEKSQQVYNVIDKSRVMKMPFEGLSLLDYAINASLVLSNIALLKQDRAGLVTFAENISSFIPADKKGFQMQRILETLYRQKTRYLESDFEKLFILLRRRVSQRSLIILYTNFESINSMRRQLPYLKKISSYHLLLIVFFENTELEKLANQKNEDIEDVYKKTLAENFMSGKRQIVKELSQSGIMSILTEPEKLTVNVINKYLEIKSRQMI
ncbi:MAG: DUF58 domain-containing protein [Bacteroidetes bacterium]|nr:DUF58 domain-containing protein [Bacteroidota bacterium]